MEESAKDFVSHFSVIQDLRIERNKLHKLESILFIAVCSVSSGAESWAGMAVRTHWKIENKVHWCLDVTFREDQSTVRVKTGARNFALLRRLPMNILRKDVSAKKSIRMKRHLAGWDPKYLEPVLAIN